MEKGPLAIIIILGVAVAGFAGWTLYSLFFLATDETPESETEVVIVAGSTTVLPIAEACAERFMDDNDGYDIRVTGGGSSYGITAVGADTVDIGMASRPVEAGDYDDEWAEGVTVSDLETYHYEVAGDGVAVIISTSNTDAPDDLSLLEIRGIWNGTYTQWNEVGGTGTETINVYGRATGSGTRSTFHKYTDLDDAQVAGVQQDEASNGDVRDAVKQDSDGIGYVGLGYVDGETVVSLSVEGVQCNKSSVGDSSYPISRKLHFYCNEEPEGAIKDFIDFVMGSDAQSIIEDEGFVSIN